MFSFIVDLIDKLFGFLFEVLSMLFGGDNRNTTCNADFISEREILSGFNKGFCLTGKRNLSVKDSYQNALVVGGTGVGKSSLVLIPSLYTMQSSFVVHDPSGELFEKTSGYLASCGYVVKVLNFSKPQFSCGYNPLARANSSSEIQKVSSMLIENALGRGKDPFWNTQAVALLAMLITILKKQDVEYQNLFNVRHLLNQLGANPKSVDTLFSKYADDTLFAEYKSFIAYDDKVISGVIATCKAAVQIFNDDAVARVTAFDSINFSDFRNKPVALFIQNSIADQKYFRVLTSIFFEQFFSYLLSRFPLKNEKDVFLLVDEAPSLNLPTLPLAVANVRKHRSGIMLLLQDFAQIIHHYGRFDADAIKSNCFAKLYFTGQSLDTTKELESTLGKYEFLDNKGQKVVRSLMTSDEIRTIAKNKAILICGNLPPILTKLRPYYKRMAVVSFAHIPPVNVSCEVPSELSLLPLVFSQPANANAA